MYILEISFYYFYENSKTLKKIWIYIKISIKMKFRFLIEIFKPIEVWNPENSVVLLVYVPLLIKIV